MVDRAICTQNVLKMKGTIEKRECMIGKKKHAGKAVLLREKTC